MKACPATAALHGFASSDGRESVRPPNWPTALRFARPGYATPNSIVQDRVVDRQPAVYPVATQEQD